MADVSSALASCSSDAAKQLITCVSFGIILSQRTFGNNPTAVQETDKSRHLTPHPARTGSRRTMKRAQYMYRMNLEEASTKLRNHCQAQDAQLSPTNLASLEGDVGFMALSLQ